MFKLISKLLAAVIFCGTLLPFSLDAAKADRKAERLKNKREVITCPYCEAKVKLPRPPKKKKKYSSKKNPKNDKKARINDTKIICKKCKKEIELPQPGKKADKKADKKQDKIEE